MDYRVFDVASVSSITPFVYASHYRGFFVGACGTSLGGYRIRAAASTSCIQVIHLGSNAVYVLGV